MKKLEDWNKEIKKLKRKVAQAIREDYFRGKTIKEITKKYGVTRRTAYSWMKLTDEERQIHEESVKRLNKIGRPVDKDKKKRKIKIKEVKKVNMLDNIKN